MVEADGIIIAAQLPGGITCAQVDQVVGWLHTNAEKLRPWIEAYAVAHAAREGEDLAPGSVPAIYTHVLRVLDGLMAFPTMKPATVAAAQAWYDAQRRP